jgi:hypothetical protein
VPTQISPALGAGCLLTQGGVGASPGYSALDIRRSDGLFITQGPVVNAGAYAVTQRGAGSNQSVDIASNLGYFEVPGSTVSFQASYTIPPHNAVINEVIAAADPTNPRIDQVILRVYDNTIDSTGNNFARTEVLTGTPQVGATLANRSGAASLSANAIRLADVLVPAGSASVTNANIKDRRPKTRGKSIIATTESRTNVSNGLMPTPDMVTEVVLPTDGLIAIAYQATWQESVAGGARASIFIGANALKTGIAGASAPGIQEAFITTTASPAAGNDVLLSTGPLALASLDFITGGSAFSAAYTGDVTTGQVIGGGVQFGGPGTQQAGGPCYVFAAAGSYDISVQYRANSGSVTAKNRKLWVWTMDPALGCLA